MTSTADPAGRDARRREVTGEQLRAIKLWCRRRADTKLARCREIAPMRLQRLAHDEIRDRLGLTVDEHRRARRWLEQAADRCTAGDHLGIDEALRAIADEHVERVLRVGLLREQGATREQTMQRLGLTRDALDIALEWWHDAVSATRRPRTAPSSAR